MITDLLSIPEFGILIFLMYKVIILDFKIRDLNIRLDNLNGLSLNTKIKKKPISS